jgi:hypothetical protein
MEYFIYLKQSKFILFETHISDVTIKINFKDVDQCGRFNGTSGQSSRTYLDQVSVQDVKDEPDLTEQIWSCIGGRCLRMLLLSASHLLSDTNMDRSVHEMKGESITIEKQDKPIMFTNIRYLSFL